jgi:hypothetical protein
VDGLTVSGLARWDGSAWHSLAVGLGSSVHSAVIHGGRLYAGGSFNQVVNELGNATPARGVAVWDGASWPPVGSIGPDANGTVLSLASYRGQLYAAYFPHGLYRWAGSQWEEVAQFTRFQGHGLTPAKSAPMTLLANGNDLYVGGLFSRVIAGNDIARVDDAGSAYPNVEGQRAWNVAKFDGTTWSGLGSGLWSADLFGNASPSAQVYAMAGSPEGLWIGGIFTRAGNAPAMNVALWHDFVHNPVAGEPAPSSSALSLSAPFPNPARLSTSISLSLAETEKVRIALYDMLGRRVATVHEGLLSGGTEHQLAIPLSHIPAGVYLLRVEGEHSHAGRLLTVIR